MSFIEQEALQLPKPNYEYVTTEEDARRAMTILSNYPIHAIDTETTALDAYEAKWSLLQVGVPDKAFIFDVRYDTEHSSLHPEILDPMLKDSSKLHILQNAAYDMKIIKRNRGYYLNNIYDTMLAEQLLTLGLGFTRANLAALVFKYLGVHMPKEPRSTFITYDQKFQEFQLEYAANDVVPLHFIRDLQLSKIQNENLEIAADLEFRFLVPLCEMELNGICVDSDKWRVIMEDIEIERGKIKQSIHKILSSVESQTTLFNVPLINIDSNAQLLRALNKYGIPIESTSEEVLSGFAGLPVIDAILDYRKANKLISTYAEPLLAKINTHTGRLHTDFKQMVSTGRMSSSNPNLQNIPRKQKYRSCFVAPEGYSLLTSDMSGAELRILGNLSQDPVFIEAYATGQDIHTRTASEMYGVPYDKVEKVMRTAAKSLNFGLCLPQNTIVCTDSGLVKIKDAKIDQNIAHDVGIDKIIDKKCMGKKEVFELKTRLGYSVKSTEDHLFKVIDKNGSYVDKKVKNLDIDNDFLCLKLGSNIFSARNYIFEDFTAEKISNYKNFDLPKTITKEWAAFLGLFVAEGSISKVKGRKKYSRLQFGFSDSIYEFVNLTDSMLYSLFGDRLCKVYNRKRGIVHYLFSSVLFGEWLATICGIKGKDKTKEIVIPECVKLSTKEIQVEFLRWLFEGDGSAKQNGNGYRITYNSKSYNLVQDLQLMLLNFGILSSIRRETRKDYPGEIYYELAIVSNKSRDIFCNEIGFVTDYKNNKCENNCLGVGDLYIKKLSEYDEFFKFIYENNIIPLPIESIESRGIEEVYDLSVENHQYFVANGFIVHNCYGMSAPGLAKRLGIPTKKAEELIGKYFNSYKGVKRYLDKAGKDAVKNRYSQTVAGRKRYYNMPPYDHPDRKKIQSRIERQGKNASIQGCLVGDTIIRGKGAIKNYVGTAVEINTGFGKDKAIGVYSGKKEVYDLKLSNGAVLSITGDHNIPALDGWSEDEVFKDVPAHELLTEYLLVPLDVVEGTKTYFDNYEYKKRHWRETYVDYECPKSMDEKLAFVIGCLIGDGSYTMHNHFRFVCPSDQIELFKKFNTYVKDLFGYCPVENEAHKDDSYKQNLPYSQVSSVVIRGFLKHIGLDYVKHDHKEIPNYFYTETIKNRSALLNGLFSTDGGITENSGPNFTTISKKLANGVHQLLFSLGINANLKEYIENNRIVYRLQIPKRFCLKFKKYIGFSVNSKQSALIAGCEIPKFGDGSIVPVFIPKLIEKTLRKYSNIYYKLTKNERAHLRRFKLGKCSFNSWRKFYNKLPECQEKKLLSKYLNFDFCTLTSSEYRGIEDTYDLMCENIHYFTANGIMVHNSNADTIKEAMIILVERLKNYDARLILTVHDEVVVEAAEDQKYEVAPIVAQSLIDGFGKYFNTIPMSADTLIGPCWLKDSCENKPDDKNKCGCTEMKFIEDKKFGTKLVCSKCGKEQ